MTHADDAMVAHPASFRRSGVEPFVIRPLVIGDAVRDWSRTADEAVIFPYDSSSLLAIDKAPRMSKWLWTT